MRFIKLLSALFILFLFSSCGSSGKFRAPVKENGKYGYIDESGDYVIDAKYEEAWSFIRGSAVVKENGKFGLIDKDGKFIVEPVYDSIIPFSATCCIVQKDSAFGFMANGTGKILIQPEFEKVYSYTDKLCVVQKGKALGIVNSEAKLVCPVIMQDFKEMFNTGAICIQSDTSDEVSMLLSLIQGGGTMKKGLINFKGEILVQPKYDEILDDLSNGFYYPFLRSTDSTVDEIQVVTAERPIPVGKYGIIDTSGKIIAEPTYDEIPVYGDGMFRVKIGAKYGYVNADGKLIIQAIYLYGDAFSEGKAIVSIADGKASIIDKTGKVLVENLGQGAGFYRFYNGLARCRSVDGKYGYLDETGKRVIPPDLDVADDFANNRAIVSINNRYGLIDRSGKFIVPNEYDFFFDLGDGYYQTKDTEGKTGVVDSSGKIILEPIYDEVFHLQKNYFTVEKDGFNGCFDLSGKTIYPTLSTSSIYFFNGRCKVVNMEGKCGVIDSTGKYIIPMVYDSIGIFFKGYASVLSGNRFGAVDSTGKVIITAKYQELRPFLNGYAVYGSNTKYGYVDLSGKEITEAKFEEAAVLVDPDRKEFE